MNPFEYYNHHHAIVGNNWANGAIWGGNNKWKNQAKQSTADVFLQIILITMSITGFRINLVKKHLLLLAAAAVIVLLSFDPVLSVSMPMVASRGLS
jgi:hypothetical protein